MNELIKIAKEHNIEIEINKEVTNSVEIDILNTVEKSFQINNIHTYIIKAIKNGNCVRLSSENIENPQTVIQSLEDIFLVQENENNNRLSEGFIKNEIKVREKIDYQEVKKDLLSLNNLKKDYPYLENIDVSYGNYKIENSIVNQNADMLNESSFHQWAVSFTMKKGKITKTDYTFFSSSEYDFDAFKNNVIDLLNRLTIKLESISCKTSKYKIILKNNCVEKILKTFAPMFFSKHIVLKESVLSDKLNKKIFSDKITIIENPRDEKAVIQKFFDEEGTKTTYKELVREGVFCTKLNNIEYALKLNEEPTGNAGGVTNLYIKPSDISYKELIKEVDNGIIIDKIEGLHSGINIKSGEISVQAEGLIVQNGKINGALQTIILSTNIFELLEHVLMVGNDMSKTDLDVSAPSLLIENITIAGEE